MTNLSNADEAKGDIWYGMHFYPGVAQYQEEGKEPYRVFLNEDTLRSMDPTFAGCPVFVYHVDEVQPDINELKKEAEGWVVESFFNQADGKHWVKFITLGDKAKRAIARGMRLSNAYLPISTGPGGSWNAVDYKYSITKGEYEHLAIVPNPRYEESIVLSPDEFKKYNEEKITELKKLSNSKDKGAKGMFKFFKKAKVENTTDIESMSVMLPKSNVEIELARLINEADEKMMKKEEPVVAQGHHLVDCNGKTMTVNEMIQKHKEMCDSMEMMKKEKDKGDDDDMAAHDDEALDPASVNDEEDQDMEHAEKEVPESADDKASEKKSLVLEKEAEKEVKDAKKKNALESAERLRNAPLRVLEQQEARPLVMSDDMVRRGKQMYGSN